jgi:FeS assembly SUF system protein
MPDSHDPSQDNTPTAGAPEPLLRLPVLPTGAAAAKLEEIRSQPRDAARSHTTNPTEAQRSLIDRALDTDLSEDQKIVRERIIETLQTIYDPELPVNLYDLGLIYRIDVSPDFNVKIDMTLTAPACPVAATLPGEVQRRVEAVPGVNSAAVQLVWDPPWNRDRMSEAALLELGLL